jgi:hypothetical protein
MRIKMFALGSANIVTDESRRQRTSGMGWFNLEWRLGLQLTHS